MTAYQSELADWLSTLPFHTFATWTLRPPNNEQRGWTDPTRDCVMKHVMRWRAEQELTPYFVVAERGMSGTQRAHAHGLLGRHGGLGLTAQRTELWKNWYARYGRCRFEPVGNIGGVGGYVVKYVTKTPDMWEVGEC